MVTYCILNESPPGEGFGYIISINNINVKHFDQRPMNSLSMNARVFFRIVYIL